MSLTIGLAVALDGLTAALGEGPDAETIFVAADLSGRDPSPALAVAVEELAERIEEGRNAGRISRAGGTDARVSAVLLPPLVETRLLRLPPLAAHEAEEVVRRTAARHFLSAGVPTVVGVEMQAGSGRKVGEAGPDGSVGVLAAAAARTLTEALHQAVGAAGWTLQSIAPAHAAWLAAVRTGSGGKGGAGAPRVVVALVGDTAHVVRVEADEASALRRLPAADLGELTAAAGPGPGRVWVFGTGPAGGALLEKLLRAGWHSAPPKESGSAAEVAARWATRSGMELVSPRLAMARRDRMRRIGIGMGAAAAVLVVAAAGLQLWGTARELAGVRERRAEIRESVQPVLAIADELWAIEDRLAAIDAVQRTSGSWTLALVELAVVLPDNVHLVGLQAAGDTLVLDAVGQRAGDALDALRGASTLTDIRQEGPIQYEVEDGVVARERFTLSALRVVEEGAGPSTDTGGGR